MNLGSKTEKIMSSKPKTKHWEHHIQWQLVSDLMLRWGLSSSLFHFPRFQKNFERYDYYYYYYYVFHLYMVLCAFVLFLFTLSFILNSRFYSFGLNSVVLSLISPIYFSFFHLSLPKKN